MSTTPVDNKGQRTASDVFSMSDEALAGRYKFSKEHGVGNWGSVWLALDKRSATSPDDQKKVAIKVVHRSKTAAAAVRVRSLWNEMKVVRLLKEGSHPSIIAYDCFIITPSYALIVMEFLPTSLPVKVDERKAKAWFETLASGVEFMHARGVAHNDIKPANILLSRSNMPILVDFGFSERYELGSADAFRSSLAYGTPEYLSPERAKGLMHDTRKSDVWSLGVTFFEIIMARTPFENDRGDNLVCPKGMDVYWHRTLKGKWIDIDSEKFRRCISPGLERLLRRMLAPNADMRIDSEDVLTDPYWSRTDGKWLHVRLIPCANLDAL
ncbi:kinase-like protein [Serendipita vermifera]|nr:kinase-like protein [Serendipita vermifera]